MLRKAILPLLAAFCSAPCVADERHLLVDSQITVAADGTVSSALLHDTTLPTGIANTLLEQLRALRFEPVRVDDRPAQVTTQVLLSACLVPIDDALVLAVKPMQFGPRPEAVAPPPLPGSVIRELDNGSHTFEVEFEVGGDGRARLLAVQGPRLAGSVKVDLERALRRWIETPAWRPEELDGVAVVTRMNWPLEISLARTASHRAPEVSAPESCQMARQLLGPQPTLVFTPAPLRLLGD